MTYAPFTLTYPSRIIFEIGGAARLAQELASFRRILLVTGSHFSGTEDFDKIMESLRGFEVRHESGIHPEPPLEDVDRLICAGREFKADCVVAIGGGSIIDSAKAAAALIPLDGWCAESPFAETGAVSGERALFCRIADQFGDGGGNHKQFRIDGPRDENQEVAAASFDGRGCRDRGPCPDALLSAVPDRREWSGCFCTGVRVLHVSESVFGFAYAFLCGDPPDQGKPPERLPVSVCS